ncbi:sorcin-like [Physella acuta]|uniref:sorcin-like n=1 Tax=Physella acuta TaxID=109671 RepID=UPI0027DDC20E|nr:sorcin-like [Physella acuta]
MSWGGQQQYSGYGQGAGQGGAPPAYGQPPAGQFGQPGGQAPQFGAPHMGQAPQYGAPPGQAPGYGGAAFGASQQGGYGAPQQGGYGAQQQGGYGAQGNFGAAPGGYGGGGMPAGVSPELWTWFQSVDTDRSGKITATELQQALMNGNWSPFNPETCRLMIGMFDKDRSGTIDIHEFAALWKYIQDWKACFDRFDTDRSGNIDANELGTALQTFGYRLSPQFSQVVVRVFDRNRGGYCINFDDFIQACVMLKSLTDKFREKDVNQTGQINIGYEEFLVMALDTTLNK